MVDMVADRKMMTTLADNGYRLIGLMWVDMVIDHTMAMTMDDNHYAMANYSRRWNEDQMKK